jgi:UDP-galactopyranose mutase
MSKQQLCDSDPRNTDLLCFSHLRWNFVFQRPQHLMSRFAKTRRLFFIEEPVAGDKPAMNVRVCDQTGVHIAVPALPSNLGSQSHQVLERLIRDMMSQHSVTDFVAWYYTPMALSFTSTLRPVATVYDCMDELSLFRGAPPELIQNEKALMARSDLVFTGGYSLFEAKCERHHRVYAFPSSVDVSHFAQARRMGDDVPDQVHIGHPRIGYAGVIDERMDFNLLQQLADMHPDWHFVMLGPVVKIELKSLPERPNIHYLGMKQYDDLPKYFAGWDVAMIPFALNESTRFISPTKTPEYLAAGLPVVSTPVRDVVRTYGDIGLLRIGSTPEEFSHAIEQALNKGMSMKWRERADHFVAAFSWDRTWIAMNRLIAEIVEDRKARVPRRMAMSVGAKLGEVLGV